MTEMPYPEPLQTFETGLTPKPTQVVPILEEGRAALETLNGTLGLGFDDWDLDYYTNLFTNRLQRNPTDVECFDMGQSNSEHSRHWFFGGKIIIDGVEQADTLFKMVKDTLPKDQPNNSVIAFFDNSRAIRGYPITTLRPEKPGHPSKMVPYSNTFHPTLTAETHNFPTGVAPFPGAETGTGGRLRDVQACGRGNATVAGMSAYCVGNLRIPGYTLPWEDPSFKYPGSMASPLDIEIEASNGASDYGNKYGEPVVSGYTRSFGQRLPNGERYEFIKPIMFSAGLGNLNALHARKEEPKAGMVVVKIGGPAYRIGMGGGAASSRASGEADAELDFNAVQRGDAEMENKLNRVLRSCIELAERNPIVSIHDQGAGGNGNVLKEIVEPLGASYDLRKIPLGDPTLSALEIWGAEYQENDCFLTTKEDLPMVLAFAKRENCTIAAVGEVTEDGRVVVEDSNTGTTVVDLPLDLVLGKMPQKEFPMIRVPMPLRPLALPDGLTAEAALDRVLRLLAVGCKRFLTNKVDRSVTGLVAQQQCVGPLHIPLANVAVLAQSHLSTTGAAITCGEQPIKGLIDPAAMARMTVAETITNIMWAKLSSLTDIKVAGNWMWAAKFEGEGPKMYDCCKALRDILIAMGVGIDGGKDSLSMAARVESEVVKSPGNLTVPAYCTVSDITKTVTPDLKRPDESSLVFVELDARKARLGGTALAQVYNQLGDQSPDVEDPAKLVSLFTVTQQLIEDRALLAGHDRSDGGLITVLLEMAFAGNCGLDVDLTLPAGVEHTALATLFNEEVGIVLEVPTAAADGVAAAYAAQGLAASVIGKSTSEKKCVVRVDGETVVDASMPVLRDVWEATGFELEKLQCNPECAIQEHEGLASRTGPTWHLTYTPEPTPVALIEASDKPKVAVIRQEGSNGDREMISAFHAAGFEVFDVHVNDLLAETVALDAFQGIVFVGGFSYADVLDSAKGWAAVLKYNPSVLAQLEAFKARPDTFSLGVCNGCQLMALLGWVPYPDHNVAEAAQPRFIENNSARFESRFSSVQIQPSAAIMFAGMAGSSLGVWVAHGEGRVHFSTHETQDFVVAKQLAPMKYVDDDNNPTEVYPFNPNGSPLGIAALCSEDGRHLAMMPHPERCYLGWQWPYLPREWEEKGMRSGVGPWLRMFQNARTWCETHKTTN
jgi:phosphoribosylformylglycinamidine synthase